MKTSQKFISNNLSITLKFISNIWIQQFNRNLPKLMHDQKNHRKQRRLRSICIHVIRASGLNPIWYQEYNKENDNLRQAFFPCRLTSPLPPPPLPHSSRLRHPRRPSSATALLPCHSTRWRPAPPLSRGRCWNHYRVEVEECMEEDWKQSTNDAATYTPGSV
jgi:hypothetical protein